MLQVMRKRVRFLLGVVVRAHEPVESPALQMGVPPPPEAVDPAEELHALLIIAAAVIQIVYSREPLELSRQQFFCSGVQEIDAQIEVPAT